MSFTGYPEPCSEECAFCFRDYTDVLGKNPLFRGIPKRALGGMIRNIHHQVRQLDTHEVLAAEGEELSRLMIIVEGAVAGEMMDYSGKFLRVETITAPQSIATAFLFGNGGKLPVTVTATESTKIFCIPKEDLVTLFGQDKKILQNFLDIISERAQFLSKRIKILSISSLSGKVAYYLLQQMKRTGHPEFILPHTQRELAEQFGATRPSVARIFRKLNEENIIASERKRIRILDRNSLTAMLSG